MQETWVQSLGWKNPLEKGMATLSSIPAWRIPWTEEPGGLQSWGHKKSDTTELTLSGRYSYDPLLQMRKLRHRLNSLPMATQRS